MSLNTIDALSANKDWFYRKVLKILAPSNPLKEVVPFPEVFRRFSLFFHFTKEETRLFLKELEKQKLIEIIPYVGVRVKRKR